MKPNNLYEEYQQLEIFEAPDSNVLSDPKKGHTMGEKLLEYLNTKLSDSQKKAILECCENRLPIEVHGAYEGHKEILFKRLGFEVTEGEENLIKRENISGAKLFNTDRPSFIFIKKDNSRRLVVLVFPSIEYVYQTAEVIHSWIKYNYDTDRTQKKELLDRVTCWIYPKLSNSLAEWTQLDKGIRSLQIQKGDILIIGYIDLVCMALKKKGFERVFQSGNLYKNGYFWFGQDKCFGANILKHHTSQKRCIVLGVKFSFWGSASAKIVEVFLNAGVRKVIYAAKAGARIIKNPQSSDVVITGAVYSIRGPFSLFEYGNRYSEQSVYAVKSGMESITNSSQIIQVTHTHLSVPSVVGETRGQEVAYNALNPTTIDNEISHIAKLIKLFNDIQTDEESKCLFDSIHYITDFVTSSTTDPEYAKENGLNDKSEAARERKKQTLLEAYTIISEYIHTHGVTDQKKNSKYINSFKLFYYRNLIKYNYQRLEIETGIKRSELKRLENFKNKEKNRDNLDLFPSIDGDKLDKLNNVIAKNDVIANLEVGADPFDHLATYTVHYYQKKNKKIKFETKVIVFDFDGTLTKNNTERRSTWEEIWASLGYENECITYHKQYSEKKITHAQWCKLTCDAFRIKNFKEKDLLKIADSISLVDGVGETIKQLQEKRIKLYIVSGSIKAIINKVLSNSLGPDLHNKFVDIKANDINFDQNDLIEHIQGTLYDFEGKATFLKKIISRQNISPLNVLYIGNSSNDEFASRSGARTLCVTPHKTNPDDYKKWTHHIPFMDNLNKIMSYV